MNGSVLEAAKQNARDYDYYQDGFQVHDGPLVDSTTIAALKLHCTQVLNGEYETGRSPRSNTGGTDVDAHPPYIEASFPQDADNTILQFLRYRALGPWVAKATGASRVQVNYVITMKKYPTAHIETRVGWHQDRRYYSFLRAGSSATLWIALDDVDMENGPVAFVRGSHLWNKNYSSGFFDRETEKEDFEIPQGKSWQEVHSVLPAGWASLHSPGIVHGSGKCVGIRPRLSIAITMGLSFPGHQLSIDPEHYWGRRMNDEVACPVIYDSSAGAQVPPENAYLYGIQRRESHQADTTPPLE